MSLASAKAVAFRVVGLCLLAGVMVVGAPPGAAGAAHSRRCVHLKHCSPKRHSHHRHHKRRHAASIGVARQGIADASNSARQSPAPSSAAAAARASCPDATLLPDETNLDRINASVLCLINEQRAKNGLRDLIASAALGRVAAAQNNSMIAGNYFAHVGPDGLSTLARILASGYVPVGSGYDVGENLAWGSTTLAAPGHIVTDWMNSPEHRANILDGAYRDTGVSVIASLPAVAGAGPGALYSQEFGSVHAH